MSRVGQVGQDRPGRVGAGHRHGLLLQGLADLLGPGGMAPGSVLLQPGIDTCLAGLPQCGGGGPGRYGLQDRVAGQVGSQDGLEGGAGSGCTGPGCGPRSGPSWRARSRTGPGRHRQGRRLLVGSGDIAQGVGHGAGGLGDDGRVTPVGPGAPWGQVGDAPHRHPPAGSPPRCPCLWQPPRPRGPDGRGLVHDHQQTAVLSQALVQVPQPGLIVGQDLVEQRLTGAVQGGGPVLGLAHVDADEDINITDRYRHEELPSRVRPGASRSAADPAPTYALGLTVTAGRSPHQRSSSTGPGR